MPDQKNPPITRRKFATNALLTTAAATFAAATSTATTTVPSQSPTTTPPPQSATTAPPLSEASQSEAALRLQAILTLYPTRFSDDQRAGLKKICNSTQSSLDRLRAYKTENSDDPALHFKPLIEHEKSPSAPHANSQPAPAAPKP